mgnify:CR=1 FL=1
MFKDRDPARLVDSHVLQQGIPPDLCPLPALDPAYPRNTGIPLAPNVELLEDSEQGPPGPALEALFATLKRQGLEAVGLMPGAPPQVAQLIEGATEPGMLADLLVVDGDPLEDVTILQDRARLRLIVKDGVIVKNNL